MVFMGSEAFPDENAYDSYLQQHGGSSNAYTDAEQTVFHCDVRPDALRGALERFAAQFVAPLCLESATDRELRAVESEFTQAQQSDSARLMQVQAATCVAGHPAAKFGWGNASSLMGGTAGGGASSAEQLRSLLMAHHGQHYVAPRMTLALLGCQPLDELQAWTEELFSGVPGAGGSSASSASQPLAIAPSFASWGSMLAPCHGHLVRLPSVKDAHTLTASFSLPALWERYETKPEEYASHLLGHESQGSLLAALKDRGLSTGLCAGVSEGGYERSTCGWTLSVGITLTQAGLDSLPTVAQLLFAACALLRRAGPQRWVWDELAGTKAMEFRFQEEEDSLEYVTRIAANASRFAPEHAVDGEWRMTAWDAEAVAAVLQLLVPQNCRLDLQSALFTSGGGGDHGVSVTPAMTTPLGDGHAAQALHVHTERWMGVPYTVTPLPQAWLTEWTFPEPASLPHDLALPPRNTYIPTDFSLVPDASTGSQRMAPSEDDDLAYPLVANTRLRAPAPPARLPIAAPAALRLRGWHKLDGAAGRFGSPRGCAFFCIASPASAGTAIQEAHTQVALRLLEDALAQVTYLADVAGLRCHVSHDGMRADLKVDGFSQHLGALVTHLFAAIAALPSTCTDAPRLARVREAVARRLRNALLKPLKHASYLRLRCLRSHGHGVQAQLKAVEDVDGAALARHVAEVLASARVDALVVGNVTAADAQQLLVSSAAHLPSGPHGCSNNALGERVLRVPSSTSGRPSICVFDTARNGAENNSAVEVYFQVGTDACADTHDRALADLAAQLIAEPAFDTLRTKEQLGYTVMSGTRLTHGVLGFVVAVQSAKHGPQHLEARIDAFLDSFRMVLAAMPSDEFECNRAAVVAAKLQKDRTLSDEADRHWDAIWHGRRQWSCREMEASAVQGFSHADVLAWYDTHLRPGSATRRALTIRVAAPGVAAHEMNLAKKQAEQWGAHFVLGDDDAVFSKLRNACGSFEAAPEDVPASSS